MNKSTKYISALTLSILVASTLATAAYAVNDAPPSLDFGSLLGDPQQNDAPPNVNLDDALGGQQNDAPPNVNLGDALGNQQDNNSNNGSNNSNEIDITRDTISPKIFNPSVDETTLKFTLNKDARVDVEIKDRVNQTVATLASNQLLTAGEYEAKWNGTTNNERGGTIVPNGDYSYKITAKNPNTGLAKDTATGTVTVRYAVPEQRQNNFQNFDNSQNQAASTLAIQNRPSGRTSETGPGILLYGIFPLAGWVAARRKQTR